MHHKPLKMYINISHFIKEHVFFASLWSCKVDFNFETYYSREWSERIYHKYRFFSFLLCCKIAYYRYIKFIMFSFYLGRKKKSVFTHTFMWVTFTISNLNISLMLIEKRGNNLTRLHIELFLRHVLIIIKFGRKLFHK